MSAAPERSGRGRAYHDGVMTLPARLRRRLVPGLAAALLAGCGGGLWIELGDDDWYDGDPSVSIAAASATAVAGGTLHVIAAAADDDGIDEVAFYRRDGSRWTYLGADTRAPYEWWVPVPADGRVLLKVAARATDRGGREADSEVLQVPVVR